MDRYNKFLAGYKSVSPLSEDYEERFHFYRLRYTISKLALRVKLYTVNKSEEIKRRLEVGKAALQGEMEWLERK